jgi:hypothetical protein
MNRIDLLIFEDAQEEKDRRAKQKADREKRLQEIEDKGCCECCKQFGRENRKEIEWVGSMTRYHWDIDKDPFVDPNRSLFLCPECAEEHCNHMSDMWQAYYGG